LNHFQQLVSYYFPSDFFVFVLKIMIFY